MSVQQTADGGYVVAGGTIDCGSGSSCPPLSGRSCALVEKLDSAGRLTWARAYAAGPDGSALQQIRQTADGGYVAAGAYYTPTSGPAPTQVLVARFTTDGGLAWQHGFATPGSGGAPTSVADASSIISTADGGYAVAGRWSDQAFNGGNGARGALLLKLDASGILQWQQAYSGGVYCFFNGYSQTCSDIGAVSYSLHQTPDGGYVLAGDGDLELTDSVPIVPWLAKADANGNLLWQHFYYQTYTTGRPLSEDFQAAATASGGGSLATGPTLNYGTQKTELYAVRTDSSGLAGTCGDIHPATPLQAIAPQLAAVAPGLPLGTATTQAASAPAATVATSISTQQDC